MKSTKNILLIVLTALFFATSADLYAYQNPESGTVLLDDNKLTINGTSNVTDFECVYEEEDVDNYKPEIQQAKATASGQELFLVVDSFDCGKKGINRDFRNTLKSEIYPTIHVELLEVLRKDDIPTIAMVNISLVGITREYGVELGEAYTQNGETLIEGKKIIKMTDFNLDPPRALFGLIKVNDEMTINFTLRVK